MNPLKIKTKKWLREIDVKLVLVKNIVKKKPVIPIKFFKIFICRLLRRLDENSNKITADDQQIAVRIAKISPLFKFSSILKISLFIL
tara:strand:+ start:704 stop:964 length:261 start_codon:yes stop_codon:yes gene_type:complete